jgi:hypothetical protein
LIAQTSIYARACTARLAGDNGEIGTTRSKLAAQALETASHGSGSLDIAQRYNQLQQLRATMDVHG